MSSVPPPLPLARSAQPTYIIGHKNPDADAICSALAYAAFKEASGQPGFKPARCGNSNARIDAILNRFGASLPEFVGDVIPRIEDIMHRDPFKVSVDDTCARALELLVDARVDVPRAAPSPAQRRRLGARARLGRVRGAGVAGSGVGTPRTKPNRQRDQGLVEPRAACRKAGGNQRRPRDTAR